MTNEMINLKCPSCGSPMGTPDAQGMALCGYCGTKVVVPITEDLKEKRNFLRYQELCKVAREAKSWKDLLKYSDEILEIDPKNVDGWVDKALATGCLSNLANDRFDEATGYLKQAIQLSPNYARITEAKDYLQGVQFNWYTKLALEQNTNALNFMRAGLAGRSYAQDHSIKAMGYFVKALKVKPSDISTLNNIKIVSENGRKVGVTWYENVQTILAGLEQAKAKQAAAEQLRQLHEKLKKHQAELAKLKQKKGFLASLDIENVQKEIKKDLAEIGRLEKIVQGST